MTASIPHYGSPVSRGVLADLGANLACGLRSALFWAPAARRWRPFAEQVLALALLDLLLALGFGILEQGGQGSLDWTALPRAVMPVPIALLAGWLVARHAKRLSLLPAVTVALLAITVWFDLVGSLVGFASARGWSLPAAAEPWFNTALFAWWAMALGLVLVRLAGAEGVGWMARVRHAVAPAAVMVLPFWYIPYLPLWQGPAEEGSEADAYAVSREEVFYGQPALLEAALERLAPQRPGVEDVYFVGVAGDASEDVFLNEAGLAEQVIRRRFGTDGRSVLLANNPRTVRTLPLASVTALRRTLRAVADTMDPAEDVLFLFLTTHGSPDHSLAMDFWPLQLQGVTPAGLRQMLEEAGIRWRVIVISACFSGGYIDALKSDETLLMTAADASRSSFGCGSESELTYFGRAYFGEALDSGRSLMEAFRQAQDSIRRREQIAGLDASNPQLFVGRAMAEKLARIEGRVAVPGGVAVRPPCTGTPEACGHAEPRAN